MMWSLALTLSLVLVLISPSLAHDHQSKRHHVYYQGDLAQRQLGSCSGSRFTWFDDGLGACGAVSQPGDFIVALNSAQFSKEYCFQQITITIGGVTQTATITDECPGCPPCGLDFSLGLFQAFAPIGDGVLTGDWSLGSGSPPPSSPSPSPSPPPPPPPPPPSPSDTPTTSWAPSPTPTPQPSPTTTSTTTTSSSTTSGASKPTTAPTPTTTNNIVEPSGTIPGETAGSSVLLSLDSYLALFAGLLESCSSSQ